tara:strand:+ start:46 stop:1323 length:1278 start_codon:yes stop_codon:yes gene_type:complete
MELIVKYKVKKMVDTEIKEALSTLLKLADSHGVKSEQTARKVYSLLSLQLHPDRIDRIKKTHFKNASEKEAALINMTELFQELSNAEQSIKDLAEYKKGNLSDWAAEYGVTIDTLNENAKAKDSTERPEHLISTLISVAGRGKLDTVNRLLNTPGVVEHADADDNAALKWAASNGHLDVVKRLLEIKEVKNNAAVALKRAVAGSLDVVNCLLDIPEVNENAAAGKNTALRWAVECSKVDIVKRLLEIEVVKNNAAADFDLVKNVIEYSNVEIINSVLAIVSPDVKNNALEYLREKILGLKILSQDNTSQGIFLKKLLQIDLVNEIIISKLGSGKSDRKEGKELLEAKLNDDPQPNMETLESLREVLSNRMKKCPWKKYKWGRSKTYSLLKKVEELQSSESQDAPKAKKTGIKMFSRLGMKSKKSP